MVALQVWPSPNTTIYDMWKTFPVGNLLHKMSSCITEAE